MSPKKAAAKPAAPVAAAPFTGEVITISPSDMSFALDECLRCLYLKIMRKERKPSTPMAAMFTAIDGGMKKLYDGAGPDAVPLGGQWSGEPLPAGAFSMRTEWVRSEPFTDLGFPGFAFRGKVDTIYECTGGADVIPVDFKTSRVKPEYVTKYGRQLHAYGWCMEHPAPGPKPKRVVRAGLLSWALDDGGVQPHGADERVSVKLVGTPAWHEVEIDWEGFTARLVALLEVLAAPEPPAPGFSSFDGKPCAWCSFRGSMATD